MRAHSRSSDTLTQASDVCAIAGRLGGDGVGLEHASAAVIANNEFFFAAVHTCAADTNDTHFDFMLSREFFNIFLQLCAHRDVAREVWHLLLLLYGLISVLLMSKHVGNANVILKL